MQIAILQPSFIPWLGYFDQMARVDAFVFLDDVQFTRRDWRNRNKIRTTKDWMWLTVPVVNSGHYRQSLMETKIDSTSNWRPKHLNAFRHNYARAPYFDLYFPELVRVYERDWTFLLDFCFETLDVLKTALGIEVTTICSSELNVDGDKSEKILALCEAMQATEYLTGDLARDYLDIGNFHQKGITLKYQNYAHPEYPQQGEGFLSHLSALDLLFNVGPRSLEVLSRSSTMETADAS